MGKRGLLLLILIALVAPRLVTLRGTRISAMYSFEDQPVHQLLLDDQLKRRVLPHPLWQHSYLTQNPRMASPARPTQWPMGVYNVALLWAWLFGSASVWTTLLTNLLFTALLGAGIWGLGRAVGGGRLGLLSALVCALCPPLYAASLYLSLDYPLVAMTVVGLLLLHQTDGFSRLAPCISFAAWSALGMYVKPTYAFYLLGPTLWILGSGLGRAGGRRRTALCFTAVVALSPLLALLLIDPNWTALWADIREHLWTKNLPGAQSRAWTWDWLSANAKFITANFPLPLLLLSLPGLALAHRRGAPAERLLVVFCWSTLVMVTLIENKMARYVLPLYPVLCLLALRGAARLAPARWTAAAQAAMVLAFAVMLGVVHQHPTPWFQRVVTPQTMRPDAPITDGLHPMFHEFNIPEPSDRRQLRRFLWDPACQLAPLFRQIKKWLPAEPLRPVAFACLNSESEQIPHQLLLRMVPGILQQFRRRPTLIPHPPCQSRHITPALLEAPELVVLLEQNMVPAKHLPAHKIQHQARVRITCEDRIYELPLVHIRN